MDHNSNPKPEILKGSQSQRQPAARAAQFNHALELTTGLSPFIVYLHVSRSVLAQLFR